MNTVTGKLIWVRLEAQENPLKCGIGLITENVLVINVCPKQLG